MINKEKWPYKHSGLTEQIISAFYNVYNELGYGFLEKVYENAMAIELQQAGLKSVQQSPIRVYYAGQLVGDYYADIIVSDLIIVELKAIKTLTAQHEAQLLNYLKATTYETGLLLNFGPKPQIKRRAFENTRKEWWARLNEKED
ncbi:MAG: GxxExxY protein [Anaerolineae bacterium]|nr:GxxExxY protein [Anaerolineae bacterium]